MTEQSIAFARMVLIRKRIKVLEERQALRLNEVSTYSGLSEIEKIPLRVKVAEIMALKEITEKHKDEKYLDTFLNDCLQNEYYCAAEGIKNAINWLKRINKNIDDATAES